MFYWSGDGEVIEGFQSWLNEQDRFTEGHDTIVYHYDGKKHTAYICSGGSRISQTEGGGANIEGGDANLLFG